MSNAALDAIVAGLRANPYTPDKSVEQLRAETEANAAKIPLPDGVAFESVDAGGVPAEWIRMPESRPGRVFVFFHGGGYYRGSVRASRALAARIAGACRATALSVEYRLAPEHPFPAALDDALAAWRHVLERGIEPGHAMVGGFSAGGGLTLALLLAARDAAVALPAGGVAVCPWTDLTQSGASYRENAEHDPTISKRYLDRMAGYYLADADPRNPLASPLFGELGGLPPLLLQVGSIETMLDDSIAFAARAKGAGVETVLETWPDMVHSWHAQAHRLPQAAAAIARIGEFFAEHVD